MRYDQWKAHVEITSAGDSSSAQKVNSNREAAHLLLDHWSGVRGRAYKADVIDCTRALRGIVSQEIVRIRLKDAALEAGLQYKVVNAPDEFEMEIAAVCLADMMEYQGATRSHLR